MNSKFKIQSFVHVRNSKISLNYNILFEDGAEEFKDFIKIAYKALGIDYPKFFKMDNLSKLALIAADVLIQNMENIDENTAIILSNRASSLDTDRKHQESISDIDNYYPSPSVFVYTLPNICIGEICIKHQLFSENSFYIFENFNPNHLWLQSEYLLKTGKANKVICGWVDFDDSNYDAFLYAVEKNGDFDNSIENIKKLYLCQ
ncbi:3-oxoacyl-ACP synthase [Confluentibacter flavum]|uniref:3-oxoacyl-ACP synthase n=1 Tax=Confluentibacter flavum TaxID=1909700 RepID=A0A2N3HKL5_9FLAO|nr:3-oxoacyl-ACP synthase [Confluentibacter flavum]PKQ45481.1 3-oxoacyl-ACP synthase [Confluentibacter flavum]